MINTICKEENLDVNRGASFWGQFFWLSARHLIFQPQSPHPRKETSYKLLYRIVVKSDEYLFSCNFLRSFYIVCSGLSALHTSSCENPHPKQENTHNKESSYYPYFQGRVKMLQKHSNKSNLSKYIPKLEKGLGVNPCFYEDIFLNLIFLSHWEISIWLNS